LSRGSKKLPSKVKKALGLYTGKYTHLGASGASGSVVYEEVKTPEKIVQYNALELEKIRMSLSNKGGYYSIPLQVLFPMLHEMDYLPQTQPFVANL